LCVNVQTVADLLRILCIESSQRFHSEPFGAAFGARGGRAINALPLVLTTGKEVDINLIFYFQH
jgi:hypothetical protein